MIHVRRLLQWSGLAGAAVGFGTTLTATLLSPTFSWTGSALSDLGAPGATTPWLFNGGLVAAGLFALPFAIPLWRAARSRVERLGTVCYGLTVIALAFVGLFPKGTGLHFLYSAEFFVLLVVTVWVHGSGVVLAGDPVRGLASIWLGIGSLLVWTAWLAGIRPGGGVAIPEFVGSVVLLVWVILSTRAVRRRDEDTP